MLHIFSILKISLVQHAVFIVVPILLSYSYARPVQYENGKTRTISRGKNLQMVRLLKFFLSPAGYHGKVRG